MPIDHFPCMIRVHDEALLLKSLARAKAMEANARSVIASRSPIILVGDSITQILSSKYTDLWNSSYKPLGAATFAAGGETSCELAIDLQYLMPLARPKVVEILIGTNDPSYSISPAATVRYIMKSVAIISQYSPSTKVLLVGLLPKGHDDVTSLNVALGNAVREKKSVRYVDIGSSFRSDGRIRPELYLEASSRSLLHPSEAGAKIMTSRLIPLLKIRLLDR